MESKTPSESPYDGLDRAIGRVELVVIDERLGICRGCDTYHSRTDQCKACWCIMSLKSRLPRASCPLGKWGPAPLANLDAD
jgi:hypothetical protein